MHAHPLGETCGLGTSFRAAGIFVLVFINLRSPADIIEDLVVLLELPAVVR